MIAAKNEETNKYLYSPRTCTGQKQVNLFLYRRVSVLWPADSRSNAEELVPLPASAMAPFERPGAIHVVVIRAGAGQLYPW